MILKYLDALLSFRLRQRNVSLCTQSLKACITRISSTSTHAARYNDPGCEPEGIVWGRLFLRNRPGSPLLLLPLVLLLLLLVTQSCCAA